MQIDNLLLIKRLVFRTVPKGTAAKVSKEWDPAIRISNLLRLKFLYH